MNGRMTLQTLHQLIVIKVLVNDTLLQFTYFHSYPLPQTFSCFFDYTCLQLNLRREKEANNTEISK